MAEIIKARVWQKADTEENWNANPLILGNGEQAFVVSSAGMPINFKIGDGTKRFSDLPWWIQYDGGQYVQIAGNVLPEPPVDVGYSLVGPGTYTFAGQADVVAPEGRLSQLLWDGTSWSLVDMGELPVDPNSVKKDEIDIEGGVSSYNYVKSIDENFVQEEIVTQLPATFTDGFITYLGGTSSNPACRRTSVNNPNMFNVTDENAEYLYTGNIDLDIYSQMCGLLFYDETFVLLGYDLRETGVFNDYVITKPSGTRYIASCSVGGDPIIKEKKVNRILQSSSLPATARGTIRVVVDPLADETDTSSKTIQGALDKSLGFENRIISINRSGRYPETLDLSTVGNIYLEGVGDVEVQGSNIITGFTKTSGRTNVYQVSYSTTIPTRSEGGRLLFENFRKSLPISDEEKHPLQRGATHFLPFTRIVEVGSLEECDSTPSSFFQSGGVLYVHNADSSNPNTSGYTIENSVRPNTIADTLVRDYTVSFNNITFSFSNGYGLKVFGRNVIRKNVTVIGAASEGFVEDVCFFNTDGDIALGCGADGLNGHYPAFNASVNKPYVGTYNNQWSAENDGDGQSHHEGSNVFVNNFLYERNKRRGVIPYGGCVMSVENGDIRNNLMEGAMVQNATGDGRSGTILKMKNVTVIGHDTNYRTTSSSTLIVESCKSGSTGQYDVRNEGRFEYTDFEVEEVGLNNIVGSGVSVKKDYNRI